MSKRQIAWGRSQTLLGLLGFVLYIFLAITLPLWALMGSFGLWVGLSLTILFLSFFAWKAVLSLVENMGGHWVSKLECPILFSLVEEHSRRLRMQAPRVSIIEDSSINAAVVGWNSQSAVFFLTRGALTRLSRKELSALVAREMTRIWLGEPITLLTLARFLQMWERCFPKAKVATERNPYHSETFSQLAYQLMSLCFVYVPLWLLRSPYPSHVIDEASTRISRLPGPLEEAIKKASIGNETKQRLYPTFAKELFSFPVSTQTTLFRLFLGSSPDWKSRLESLRRGRSMKTLKPVSN